VKWVVIACMALMDQLHLSDGIGCHDVVRCGSHPWWWSSCHPWTWCNHPGVGASAVGGFVCCPAMIAVSSWMARMCLILLADDFGTVPPNTLRRSAAAAMETLCCKVTGTWQWAGYKHQVLEKRKRHVAGM
jgi:hypothetical protein